MPLSYVKNFAQRRAIRSYTFVATPIQPNQHEGIRSSSHPAGASLGIAPQYTTSIPHAEKVIRC